MLFRILTEDLNREAIKKIVSLRFPSATLLPGDGIWRGKEEKSLVIEIEASKKSEKVVDNIAKEIKIINKQKKVMIQLVRNCAKFI